MGVREPQAGAADAWHSHGGSLSPDMPRRLKDTYSLHLAATLCRASAPPTSPDKFVMRIVIRHIQTHDALL